MMRTKRMLIPAVALAAAAATVAFVPVGSAQALTNGLGIHTVTKNLVQGDTSRVQGKVVGAGKVTVTIQQRSPGRGKDWGSGRQVTTNSQGKFTYDRVIKGKYTRDYRVCTGKPGHRKCSLRARIEVVPRTIGTFVQSSPAKVTAGGTMTVRGSTEAALVGRTVTLQELNAATLQWLPVASATVTPGATFEVTGTPVVTGKQQSFRLATTPFAGRPSYTLSNRFTSDIYASYPLSSFTAAQGGLRVATVAHTGPAGGTTTYTGAVTPAETGGGNGIGTVNLAAQCDRMTADVFLADDAATDARMKTSVTTAIGANTMTKFQQAGLTKNTAVEKVDIALDDVQTLTINENLGDAAGSLFAPVWYGNAQLSCVR